LLSFSKPFVTFVERRNSLKSKE